MIDQFEIHDPSHVMEESLLTTSLLQVVNRLVVS